MTYRTILILLALGTAAPGCNGTRSTPPPRRVAPRAYIHPALRQLTPAPRCPLPRRKNPAKWFYDIAMRMRHSQDGIARAARKAHRMRDVLLYACLNAKAKAAADVMGQVAGELPALRQQTPPDPLVTRRILANCEQVQQLVNEARRCIVPPPPPRRPPGETTP